MHSFTYFFFTDANIKCKLSAVSDRLKTLLHQIFNLPSIQHGLGNTGKLTANTVQPYLYIHKCTLVGTRYKGQLGSSDNTAFPLIWLN